MSGTYWNPKPVGIGEAFKRGGRKKREKGKRKEGRREGRSEGREEGESREGSRLWALVTRELCFSVR